jgi:hypothetical protein
MSKQTRVSHPIYSRLPTEVEGFDSLAELALDMRRSWNHATNKVWRELDPELRKITQHWPQDEIPVGHVINGLDMPTWDLALAADFWTEAK